MSIHDPFADLARLRHRIERAFDEAAPAGRAEESGRVWRPPVDLFEDEDELTLRLDVPGIDQSKLDIQLTGEELVVRGERPWSAPEKGGCVHSERVYGQFHRGFRLGIPVQHEKVQASYKDGVLTIVLPKAETTKPRKIAVNAESG
jgi:HSP20 family protein